MTDETDYFKRLHIDGNIPLESISYLNHLKNKYNFTPNVIYDIGSAVLDWTKNAKNVWPDSKMRINP